jgi:hypothetical protein
MIEFSYLKYDGWFVKHLDFNLILVFNFNIEDAKF